LKSATKLRTSIDELMLTSKASAWLAADNGPIADGTQLKRRVAGRVFADAGPFDGIPHSAWRAAPELYIVHRRYEAFFWATDELRCGIAGVQGCTGCGAA
jgi:hypothetical protein